MSKNYTHGGDIFSFYEKYGRYPVDFSSSLNPLVSPLEVTNAFVESYKESQEKVVQAQIAIVVEKTRRETLLYAASKMVEEFQISMDRALEVLEISEEEGV